MNYKFLLLVFVTNFMFGQKFQFSVIEDKDGFVNIRESKEIGNNIIDKLPNGKLVYHFGAEGNWINVNYLKNNIENSGYVYVDRVKNINEFKKISTLFSDNKSITFESDKVYLKITTKQFDKKSHTLTHNKEYKNVLEKVDNVEIFGTDGNIPKNEYLNFEISINSMKIELQKEAYINLFEPNLYHTFVNYDKINNRLFIQSMNSDGAGGYAVIWMFQNGKYQNRFVTIPF
jgi:hypothetical protein